MRIKVPLQKILCICNEVLFFKKQFMFWKVKPISLLLKKRGRGKFHNSEATVDTNNTFDSATWDFPKEKRAGFAESAVMLSNQS